MLGIAFYIYEIIMNLKSHHAYKRRITYREEGDGFQADDILHKWYKYEVFMHTE